MWSDPLTFVYFDDHLEQLGLKAARDFKKSEILMLYAGTVVDYHQRLLLQIQKKG